VVQNDVEDDIDPQLIPFPGNITLK
jgi:hypothetical protein